jgi:type IV fimbrial biogenesis protein FimT
MNKKGFTLLEMLIIITIIGIIAAMTYPAFNSMVANYRLRNVAFELLTDINKAKIEAIKRNAFVSFNFNTDNNSYIIFVEDKFNRNWILDAGEDELKTFNLESYGVSYNGDPTFPKNANNIPSFGFDYRGMPRANGSEAGTISLINDRGTILNITLSRGGKVSVQ